MVIESRRSGVVPAVMSTPRASRPNGSYVALTSLVAVCSCGALARSPDNSPAASAVAAATSVTCRAGSSSTNVTSTPLVVVVCYAVCLMKSHYSSLAAPGPPVGAPGSASLHYPGAVIGLIATSASVISPPGIPVSCR